MVKWGWHINPPSNGESAWQNTHRIAQLMSCPVGVMLTVGDLGWPRELHRVRPLLNRFGGIVQIGLRQQPTPEAILNCARFAVHPLKIRDGARFMVCVGIEVNDKRTGLDGCVNQSHSSTASIHARKSRDFMACSN